MTGARSEAFGLILHQPQEAWNETKPVHADDEAIRAER
jgi:hypothetical protein